MKKIITLAFICISVFVQAQNEINTTTKTTEEANKVNQEATPATEGNAEIEQPIIVAPAQEPQKAQKQQEQTKKKGKNENEKKSAMPFLKKFYFGGTFGATFGNYTSITIAPTIGYRLRPSLYTGLKVYYTYSKQKSFGNSYEHHNYGIGTFLRWFAFKDLYLHIAPETYSFDTVQIDGTSDREWVPYLWAGAGTRKRVSKRSWVSVHVLFDMLNDKNSPYEQWEPNVVIGAGTSF
tara:strand:+ start:20881 stop:21588 length:708 start_codon:yes stop_codon:yes gene_type:complete